jgi:hypothetical protein
LSPELTNTLSRILEYDTDVLAWILEDAIDGVRVFRHTSNPLLLKAVTLLECPVDAAKAEILSHSTQWELNLSSCRFV